MRIRNPFNRLAWKLTLTYTLVTVAALMVVEAIAVVGSLFVSLHMMPTITVSAMTNGVPHSLAPYLETDPPDVAALNDWMESVSINGVRVEDSGGASIIVQLQPLNQLGGTFLVVDRYGHVLTAYAHGAVQPGQSIDLASFPALKDFLPRALAGESDRDRISSITNYSVAVAAPIRATDGTVIGAVALVNTYPTTGSQLSGLIPLIVLSLVAFTVAAGAIGTIFGFFTARSLTRRLRSIAQTATSWGHGQFSQRIDDRSGDELGKLAAELNGVAGQLEGLVQTRQQVAAMDERSRLARDLHDSIKQQVFAISMNLGAAQAVWERDSDEARRRLDEAASLARDAQQELVALIQTLRPVQLEGKTLSQALRDYAAGWERQSGIAIACEIESDERITAEAEQALFRVAQEALSNVARHSGASRARIILVSDERMIRLEIVDNGRGLDAARMTAGIGLRSMRERIEALGGTFTVASPGRGVRIIATIPIST